jgi:Ca-activated chloride channel family protein
LVQAGVRLLAERLRPDDRVAVVTYAAAAQEVRGSEPIGVGGRELRAALAGLSAGGRTNGYEGLMLAYDTARAARRASGINAVILCTDGNFNLGETDEQALAALANRFAAEGIKLSVFGFGRSDRNDLRLELLARAGGGQSCYVNTEEEAERLLAGQVAGLLEPVAREVDWRVSFNPERVAEAQRLGGQDGEVASELLPGRRLAAVYELNLRAEAEAAVATLGRVRVDFLPAGERRPALMQQTLAAPSRDWAQASPGFRFAVAMVELGRILQAEPAQAPPALDQLERWVVAHLPDDAGGYRRELQETLRIAREAAARGSDQARKSPE